MDKNALKKFAVWARRELISRVSQKAAFYGITEKDCGDVQAESINGKLLSSTEKKQRQALIGQIQAKGYEEVMEEVAYTWFNRFSALRFMEVNGYLPSHVRVFTDDENRFQPQILAEAINLDFEGLDMEKVYELKDINATEELYKYLLIVQCNELNAILPKMFQKIGDYTELLFPDNLLREGSVIEQMITLIPEKNFNMDKEGQIEIIGWLYQYYNGEKKEQVINLNKGTINKEDIPAATQLFTPDWIVRYIVDNSVGKYWIEHHPDSELKKKLEYLVLDYTKKIDTVNGLLTPQELTVFDPCMGSGHFLIYAFEVLMEIYGEFGYSQKEAAAEIICNNLYGLDIDERASQLAYFALMMKACQYDRRFLRRDIQPNVLSINESNTIDCQVVEYFVGNDQKLKYSIDMIFSSLNDAKEYGSLINIPIVDFQYIYDRFAEITDDINLYSNVIKTEVLPLVKVAELLAQKYSVVVTNPPYLNKYNDKLKKFLLHNYRDFSGDLFSAFIYRNFNFCKSNGYMGYMTPYVWMFIQTYEKLRNIIIDKKTISTLIQLEYSAFEEATVPICTFVLKNNYEEIEGGYVKLSSFKGGMNVQRDKFLEIIKNNNTDYLFWSKQSKYNKINGAPIAFWISEDVANSFVEEKVSDYMFSKAGIVTGDDKTFLRLWHEIDFTNIRFDCEKYEYIENIRWVPMNKGGSYRKYYGNYEYVMNIYDLWTEGKTNKSVRRGDQETYYQEAITWSMVTSGKASFRYSKNKVFGVAAPAIFSDQMNWSLLGYLNSKVVEYFNSFLNPTINILTGNIMSLPYVHSNATIDNLVKENIKYEKLDWDAFETSWDFKKHSLLDRSYNKISDIYAIWIEQIRQQFECVKTNEEEINKYFINKFGLTEIDYRVKEEDVTIRIPTLQQTIISLISYAVGCIFGRYSLDEDGIVYAGGEWNLNKYITFPADVDAILPVCDDDYFEDDIVNRFVLWIETVYGKKSLETNLRFIADALGGKGSSREVIRNYFLNDFYKDHCKIYQKRPIYWLFDSGKKNGFKALIYMHRYQPDTIARIRTDYVHEQQSRYRTSIADLEQRINNASTGERVKLSKQLKKVTEQAEEVRIYEEKIHHLADQFISIDLDDGVKVNYAKFQDVLAKIK